MPQNTIKYKYDKEIDTVHRPNNNTCNRIPIDISKYSKTNTRINSPSNRVQKNHVIKLDSQLNKTKEKELYEGPKYQLIGKDLPKDKPRPKTVSHSRTRSNRVRNHQIKQSTAFEKKGYIPFGGKGYKVGGAPVQIPHPNNNRNRIPKPNEDRYSSIRVERATSYTETSHRSSGNMSHNFSNYSTLNNTSNTSNIHGLKNVQKSSSITNNNKPRPRRNINSKNYQRPQINKIIEKKEYKFPGKGVRVGSSNINKSELITEKNNNLSYAEYKKFEKDNMDILEISGKKKEIVKCFEQSLCFQGEQNGIDKSFEKRLEENLCYRPDNEELFKEIFCPVHGRQLIRVSDFNN